MFWMMGKDLKSEERTSLERDEEAEEVVVANERLQRRSLSWKDDNPNELLATWHEFADVQAPDIALASESAVPSSSSLKGGSTLLRRHSSIDDDDDDDAKKRRSPNSPNWGFFVSITPPTELYSPPPANPMTLQTVSQADPLKTGEKKGFPPLVASTE